MIDHRTTHELRKGECIINETIKADLEVKCFGGRYEDKKVPLPK